MSKTTTQLEKQLSHKVNRKGVLVPLLEDLFRNPVEPEDDKDIEFLTTLFQQTIVRQKLRESKPVFSPSQLAQCLRQVYLLRQHKEHGIKKQRSTRIQPNYYFFNGNFLHVKWQFALHKLDREISDDVFKLVGCEVPIISKHGDHGGTVDAICLIYNEPYIVDAKGLNVRTFGEITRGYVPAQYTMQLADYGMLFNSFVSKKGGVKISQGLLLSENKGGADNKHPIALHETVVSIKTHLPLVRLRLETLRENGSQKEIPPPECASPYIFQFTGCPFRGFCKKEVTEIYRRNREREDSEASDLTVARPSSTARKRRKGRVAKASRNSSSRN